MQRHKVSIATACYKSEAFIERTFQSILAQDYDNLEWNVVVDGGGDRTAQLLQDFRNRAPFPVNIVVFEQNRGSGVAVTTAVHKCSGDFTLILDHDDELLPGALHGLLRTWDDVAQTEDMSTIAGVFGRCVNQRNEFLGRRSPPRIISTLTHFIHVHRPGGECACIHRTDVLQKYFHLTVAEMGSSNGLIWNRIDRDFRSIFTDLVIRRYHMNTPNAQSATGKIRSAAAYANQELEYLNDNAKYLFTDPIVFLKRITMYQRYSYLAALGIAGPVLALRDGRMRLAAVGLWPLALGLAFQDRRSGRI